MSKFVKFGAAIILSISAFSTPVQAAKKKAEVLTPLQLQALQSKEFETTKENLFGAVMTVVQDIGYQVNSADLATGFITATSATQPKTSFFEALAGSQSTTSTKMTAFVQKMPNGMSRVRLNFLETRNSSSAYGQSTQQDKPILDAIIYRNAWDKIDEALFVSGALEAPKGEDAAKASPASEPAAQTSQPGAPK